MTNAPKIIYTRFPKLRASLFALKLNILLKFKRLLKYK